MQNIFGFGVQLGTYPHCQPVYHSSGQKQLSPTTSMNSHWSVLHLGAHHGKGSSHITSNKITKEHLHERLIIVGLNNKYLHLLITTQSPIQVYKDNI